MFSSLSDVGGGLAFCFVLRHAADGLKRTGQFRRLCCRAAAGCLLGKGAQKTVFATNGVYNGFSIIVRVSRPFLANDSGAQPHYT